MSAAQLLRLLHVLELAFCFVLSVAVLTSCIIAYCSTLTYYECTPFSISLACVIHASPHAACSQLACIKCCTDIDGCEGHRALRDERRRQEAILAGTHAVNVRAAQQRKMAVTPGAFPGEPALRYLRESLIVWDCRQYLDHPRWREDAIRRSERNKRAREVFAAPEAEEDETGASKKKKEGRKRRFQRIMNELYEASVKC